MDVIRAGSLTAYEVGTTKFQPVTDPARAGGELAVWQLTVPAGPLGAPHVIDREEVFLCTSGTLTLSLDGETVQLEPGDAASAPAGTYVAAGGGEAPATATVCCRLGLTATMADGTRLSPPWAQAG